MATRRMRIKAAINVPRNTVKSEPVDQAPATPSSAVESTSNTLASVCPSSPVTSPRICSGPVSPAPSQDGLPPDIPHLSSPSTPPPSHDRLQPSSPKPPRATTSIQRPSPSRSPAASCLLPASGSVLRRSPSPALSRLSNSPGPPMHYHMTSPGHPPSPVKSPVPSPSSPIKFFKGTQVLIMPTSSSTGSSVSGRTTPVESIKSPPPLNPFRPPPSPSSIHHDFRPINSPASPTVVSRPSPAQSPVYGTSRPGATTSFLLQHLNSNSNSADSHEVASLMSPHNYSSPVASPNTDSNADKDKSRTVRGGSTGGAFSSVSNKVNSTPVPPASPSFSKTMFDDPESLKRRLDEKKKEGVRTSPTKFAAMRKEFYEKLNSGHVPEKNKLTMLHFTFYNPPDPSGAKRKSRSRASSVCSEVSTSNLANNENIGNEKAASAPSSIAGSRRTTASSVGSGGSVVVSEAGQSEHGSVASNGSAPGPRVKVGPDGQLIIDETSLVVETSESQRARQQIEDMEVVSGAEYAVGSSGYYRYKRTCRRGVEWTEKETIRFYRALNQCGTDFSMMLGLFPYRTRHELKSKFKREDKKNPDMISKALQSCVFDPSEGFSSDEEAEKNALLERDKLLNEEVEVEKVICSSDGLIGEGKGPKKIKKEKKNKEVELSSVQIQELKTNSLSFKGPGTGNGRKWNTPVKGLVGRMLPPIAVTDSPPLTLGKIKNEKKVKENGAAEPKEKRKYQRKKKTPADTQDEVAVEPNPIPVPGTVSIIIAPGALSAPILPLSQLKKEKPDEIIPKLEITSVVGNYKPPQTQQQGQSGTGNKRRNRLPKTKPNLKKDAGSIKEPPVQSKEPLAYPLSNFESSQSSSSIGTEDDCHDLFRFDASDPLGLKVVPAPLPVAQETELTGDEEGREGLVIVDLDELNSIQAQASEEVKVKSQSPEPKPTISSTPLPPTNTRRKRKKAIPVPVATARIIGDPYGKTTMASATTSEGLPKISSSNIPTTSSEVQPSNKKVKVLPYRVPGPGGVLPSSSPDIDELEIEIELTPSQSSES